MTYRRLPLLVLVVAVLVAGTSSPVDANTLSRRGRMLQLLNQTRRNHGLPVFRLNVTLSNTAWRHSGRMAERNQCFHTVGLYDAVRAYDPVTWGENVGAAGTLRRAPHALDGERRPSRQHPQPRGSGGSGSAW